MVQKRKFQEGKSIDRRKKHGRCRFDIQQPTGRFCTYWNQKLVISVKARSDEAFQFTNHSEATDADG